MIPNIFSFFFFNSQTGDLPKTATASVYLTNVFHRNHHVEETPSLLYSPAITKLSIWLTTNICLKHEKGLSVVKISFNYREQILFAS